MVRSARTPKDAGSRAAHWRLPSSGSRSTRTLGTQGRVRGGRRQIATAGARTRERTEGLPPEAEIVGTATAVPAGGRVEKGEETDVGKNVAPGARDVRAVGRTARPEAPEVSERRGRNGRTSEDCREPQPWARPTTGRPRVQVVGSLLGDRLPAELSRLQPVMAMRSPTAKVATLLQDAALPVR